MVSKAEYYVTGLLTGACVGFALGLGVAKAEEYSLISEANKAYCTEYATAVKTENAYTDCISILPTRLPIVEPGTVPASDREEQTVNLGSWEDACAAEYRTWDQETGTVIRRGSPERVKCPLVRSGEGWVLPALPPE